MLISTDTYEDFFMKLVKIIPNIINIMCETKVRIISINDTINVWDKSLILTDTINGWRTRRTFWEAEIIKIEPP